MKSIEMWHNVKSIELFGESCVGPRGLKWDANTYELRLCHWFCFVPTWHFLLHVPVFWIYLQQCKNVFCKQMYQIIFVAPTAYAQIPFVVYFVRVRFLQFPKTGPLIFSYMSLGCSSFSNTTFGYLSEDWFSAFCLPKLPYQFELNGGKLKAWGSNARTLR
jgi:hypothetical protein